MKRNVERFARRFGIYIGMGIIVLAFMAVLVLQAFATAQLQAQVTSQEHIIGQINGVTTQISNAAKQRTTQINDLNSHIDCIAKFFTVANRTYVTIDDIDSCTLKNTATGEVQSTQQSSTGTTTIIMPATTSPSTTNPSNSGSRVSTPEQSSAPATTSPSTTSVTQPGLIDRTASGLTGDVKGLLNAL